MVGWPGRCEVHEKFSVEDVENARKQFPDVLVLAHPECSPEVTAASDFAGSTAAMIRRVRDTAAPHYLLLTECSMGDNIIAENPEKEMIRICSIRCPHMNEITLEQTLSALNQNRYRIDVHEPVRTRAARSIERMLAIS
jgi:quinolinate synthase